MEAYRMPLRGGGRARCARGVAARPAYAAKREGLLQRVIQSERVPVPKAEALIAALEADADRPSMLSSSPALWDQAESWLAEQLR
jgi:hypothetical protein